jgi:HD-like signal output (HDOD) protein
MNTELLNLVDCIEHLPVLPSTTVQLVHILGDKKTPIEDVINVIQYDQNLTLQVLKLCNSAYFGLARQISSLREAVIYLGSRQIMQIVMGIHCNAMLQQPQKGYGLLAGMLWRHSTAVALISEKLGRLKENEKNMPSAGLLFTSGLLHDIGKVILDQLLSQSYVHVLERLSDGHTTFDQAEQEVLGYSHTDVGEMVMLHWQLPSSIAAVGRYHHEPDKFGGDDPITHQAINMIHLADSLAISLGLGLGSDGLQYRPSNDLAENYGFTIEHIETISVQVLKELQSLEQLYQER